MKGSKWLILLVLLVLVAIVIAKQSRKPSRSHGPVATAQAPPESTSDRAAPAAARQGTPEPQQPEPTVTTPAAAQTAPKPSPPPTGKPGNPKPSPPAGSQQSPAQPAPESKSAPGPKPEGPLPGSKLKECLENGRPTMADFGLGTCKPCKAMEPILRQAAQDYWGKANILFIELDKYPDLARAYRIAVMPTQIFFDASGRQVDSHMGFLAREDIDQRLAALGVRQ